MNKAIKVHYQVFSSNYMIRKTLNHLFKTYDLLAFDTETRSLYNKEERKEAKNYLKDVEYYDPFYKEALFVSNSSGLSHPSVIKTTHFIFSPSKNSSYIFIAQDPKTEMLIWTAIKNYSGTLIVHNSLFDLKIMYERVKTLPKNFIDTAIYAKCFINHTQQYKSKIGLKELMGSYFDPKWSLLSGDYEPDNLKDPDFLNYCAIDGAATFYLLELIKEQTE